MSLIFNARGIVPDALPDKIIEKLRVEECPVVGLDGDCWSWYGKVTAGGYATAYIDGYARRLHRYTWEVLRGEIPDRLEIDHLCRNRRCVNPDHLEPVTGVVNRERARNPLYRDKEQHELVWRRRFNEMLGVRS